MARYVTTVKTKKPPKEVFAYMADLRNFAKWDPGITVEPDGAGSAVTYDADLRLNGVLRLGDLGLRLMFGRIGDRAAAGLRRVLGAQTV